MKWRTIARIYLKQISANKIAAEHSSQPSPAPSVTFHLGYRPSLDGLRGVSILLVVVEHAHLLSGWWSAIGVSMFFGLSGFLITCLLVEEWERTGGVSLKRFYARRVLRLLPALLAMLTIMVAWEWAVAPRNVATRVTEDALVALFYVKNWVVASTYRFDLFSHTWSLSMEEQFYLIWPPLLLLLLRGVKSRQGLVRWLWLGIFLAVLDRITLVWWNMYPLRINLGTDSRADTLLLGCLVATLAPAAHARGRWPTQLLRWVAGAAVLALLLLGFMPMFNRYVEGYLVLSVLSVCPACIIASLIWNEDGWLHWLLRRRWLVYVGKISYGLYLWHSPIFLLVQGRAWPFAAELTVEVVLAVAATLTSFYILEKPFLRLKERLRADSPQRIG